MKKKKKIKKIDIISRNIISYFREIKIPLEEIIEANEYIVLASPIFLGVVEFQFFISIDLHKNTIVFNFKNNRQYKNEDLGVIVEFSNRYNKLHGAVGHAVVDINNKLILFQHGMEIPEGPINTKHIKINYDISINNAHKFFAFIQSSDLSKSTSGDLILNFKNFDAEKHSSEEINFS